MGLDVMPAPLSVEELQQKFLGYLRYIRGLDLGEAGARDELAALALVLRRVLVDRAFATQTAYREQTPKTVHYLSLEYLIGRLMHNNLIATGLLENARAAMAGLGRDLDALLEEEPDPGLGNGGLGRLAACFLDSLATLDYPAYGYGLRYEYGIFRQEFVDGWQRERPDTWLKGGYQWELDRSDLTVEIPIGGGIEWFPGKDGKPTPRWVGWRTLNGVPSDVLVAGFGTQTVSILRLWRAEAAEEFNFEIFSQGDFLRAVAEREGVEAITKVLYPADYVEAGRELRLTQEYFLVACAVRDVVRRFRVRHGERWSLLPEKVAFQLNDTHPALTVAELMRFLLDDAGLEWDEAWELTRNCCAYTNHTLLPEALETWSVGLMQRLLPRHVQIIYEINARFLATVAERFPGDIPRLERMSVVGENGGKRFRMAHLAIIGSHRVNGVARLHTELLRKTLLRDFAELWPESILPITNGVTPRRWLLACNLPLAEAIDRRIGNGWLRDLDRLEELEPFAEDPVFQKEFLAIKRRNKEILAGVIADLCQEEVDPNSLFDVQIKRLHEYKRQLLKAMHIMALYLAVKADPARDITPRTFIFGAKAAPAYHMAKLIIRLINGLAEVINKDMDVAGRLKIVFLPDYRVTLAERIIPAADLSEQISTAGMEASGTGNMKLALNGALTIGTLDGANIEIRDRVRADDIFIFGLTAEENAALRALGQYDPWHHYQRDPVLAGVVDALREGIFAGGDRNMLRPIWSSLMEHGDRYHHLADFGSYMAAQTRVEALWAEPGRWAAAGIRNIAAMGYFSSDRAIREYVDSIWGLEPVAVAAARR